MVVQEILSIEIKHVFSQANRCVDAKEKTILKNVKRSLILSWAFPKPCEAT